MFVLEYKDKTFIRIYQIYFEIIFLRVPQQISRMNIVWGVIRVPRQYWYSAAQMSSKAVA
jgi:hypothetical protein